MGLTRECEVGCCAGTYGVWVERVCRVYIFSSGIFDAFEILVCCEADIVGWERGAAAVENVRFKQFDTTTRKIHLHDSKEDGKNAEQHC